MSSFISGVREGPIPDLATKYSGVPKRLITEAVDAKAKLYSHKTLPESAVRRHIRVPPGVSGEAFDAAIFELKEALGDGNIELNDKPLVDGWYMQHPYALRDGRLKPVR